MTHCFRPIPVGAQDSSSICRDCNGDGQFTFDDLFCCARFILRGPLVPVDSVHAVPGLHVSFDPPQPSGDALYVRVHVTGADGLGAAQLRLTYPAARWQASEPVLIGPGNQGPVDWFTIADVEEPGTVQLGGGTLAIGLGGLALNFAGDTFQWTGGVIDSALGDLTNLGVMNLAGSGGKGFFNDGTLDDFGTIIQTGGGNLGLHSDNVTATTLKIERGGSYLIESDSGTDNPFGGKTAVSNAGVICSVPSTYMIW